MRYVFAITIALVLPTILCAQDKKDVKPGDEMIYKYLCAETDKLSAKVLDGAKTIDEWKAKRPRLYQEYMDMLGLWPIPEKTPLKATWTGTIEHENVFIDKIHFQSKPGLYVTANLYRPKNNTRRLPTILYVCGHSNRGRDGNKSAFQDHGLWFANNGYNCLVLDTLQLGEIPAVHHGTYGRPWISIKKYEGEGRKLPADVPENRWWWHSIGYSPAAVECWNGIRAIDYLCSRDDVDPTKIGVTGISGGGAATFWIAAADERVKLAVPVSGMADLESYVKNKVINGHCDCMFLYNTYQWDWTTIAALIAPRPLLFANSDKDPIFPMDANRRVIEKLRKLYGMYEQPKLVDDYISSGGHDYRPDLRVAIFKFINKHLKGDAKSKVEDSAKYTPLEGRKLRVFATDDDLPKDAINARIDETFITRAKVTLPEQGKFVEWKQQRVAELKSRVFEQALKRLEAPGPQPRLFGQGVWWEVIEAEKGVPVSLFGRITVNVKPKKAAIVINDLQPEPSKPFPTMPPWAQSQIGKEKLTTVLLTFRGVDPRANAEYVRPTLTEWTQRSPPNYVERSHALLGRSVDEGRLLDVVGTARYCARWFSPTTPVRIMGKGDAGILAAYAALLQPSIKEVIVIDPPKSHKEGPHFLNVLRVLDIPEALGLLAPTPLTIIGGKDAAFDRTAEIYRLAGAAEKLTRK